MEAVKNFCEFFSQIWQKGLGAINVETFELIFVSELFTKETGIRNCDIHLCGLDSYEKFLHPKDYIILPRIHNITMQYFEKQNMLNECFPIATYNIRLKSLEGDYRSFSISLKIISIETKSVKAKRVGLLICQPEIKFGFERFMLYIPDKKKQLYFSNVLGKYVSREHLEFRAIEKNILRLIANGYNEVKITKELHVKIDLIRYYKKCIYQKLYVSNMSEAIYIATLHNLI
jgi:Response regulator containing a CheY-like receiver domain and an HTH DNA-binding domain